MPPKSGLVCPRTKGHENDGDITWSKHTCRFPNPSVFSPEYSSWRNTIKRKMEQDGIRSRKLATDNQWAAIQAYALTVEPLASNGRAALWKEDSSAGRRFTECLDFLLKDVAKKHSKTLSRLGVAVPPAVPVVPAAPAVAANDRFTGPRTVRMWFDRPSSYRKDNPLPRGLNHVQWKTYPLVVWMELTEPTLENLHKAIDDHLSRGTGYRHLVGATRYGSLLLLDSPEEPLPLSEMMVLYDDQQIRMWWGQCPQSEPMDLLFRRHRVSDTEPSTPPPRGYDYAPREIRDDTPPGDAQNEIEPELDSEVESSLETDSANNNDDHPESSARAAKMGPKTTSTSKTASGTKAASGAKTAAGTMTASKTDTTPRSGRKRHRGGLDGADDSEPDLDGVPARVLRSGKQILGLMSDPADRIKPWTPVNSSSKHDRGAMMDGEDSERCANNYGPPKKMVRRNRTPSTHPNTQSSAGSPEVQNPFREPGLLVGPRKSASPTEVSAQDLELRRSAEQLLMVASGTKGWGGS